MWNSAILFVALCVCVYAAAWEAPVPDNENDAKVEKPSRKDIFKTICIHDLDCFYTGSPFYHPIYRPISIAPTRKLKTQFLLYTPMNPTDPQVLNPTEDSFAKSILDPRLETKILIHGYLVRHWIPKDAIFNAKNELLAHGPMNVIIVDWTAGNQSPYHKAVSNARVVGAQVAKMINYYVKTRHLNPKSLQLIGHGLGAHICGWAGERVPGLGRITGLDPVHKWFHNAPTHVRLDRTDAEFVDVIHTTGRNTYWGDSEMKDPIGHLDFYVNEDKHQPECSLEALKQIYGEISVKHGLVENLCAHHWAYNHFLDSINKCHHVAVGCSCYEDFLKGKCTPDNSIVVPMGYHAKKVTTTYENTSFYLIRNGKSPHCRKTNEPAHGSKRRPRRPY